jgi:hypothetical protein
MLWVAALRAVFAGCAIENAERFIALSRGSSSSPSLGRHYVLAKSALHRQRDAEKTILLPFKLATREGHAECGIHSVVSLTNSKP